MRITDVECLVLDRQFPFVRVHTDEGLVGVGECFRRQPDLTKTVVDGILGPVLLKSDPLEVKDGHIDMPDGPGLGIDLDDQAVKRLAEA